MTFTFAEIAEVLKCAPLDPLNGCVAGYSAGYSPGYSIDSRTIRPGEGPSPEPLVLWDDVSRAAAEDALPGHGATVLAAADSLQIVHCMAWPYDAPVDRLADSLGWDVPPFEAFQARADAMLAGGYALD